MSQRFTVVRNFRYGLDGRKSVLTSQPGTLIECLNAFINAGGEIEQRMSFVKDANLFPTNTFGLQDTDTGLQTYGSDAAPNAALPTGISYVQLTHPTGYVWSDPEIVAAAMTGVKFSTNYLGKAFVIAQWNDGKMYFYYNAVLIPASRNGLILNTVAGAETFAQLSTDLASQINALGGGWIGNANLSPSSTPLNGSTIVQPPYGVTMTAVVTEVSAGGQVGAQYLSGKYDGVGATSAYTSFVLSGGIAGDTIRLKAPATSAGTGTAELTNGFVPFNASLGQTALDVATAVNNYTYITGYRAVGDLATANVTVYAPASWGNVTFNLTVDGTITTGGGAQQTDFVAQANPANVEVFELIKSGGKSLRGSATILCTGGIGNPTYVWTELGSSGILINGVTATGGTTVTVGNVTFSKWLSANSAASGTFQCVVTDNAGAGTAKTVTVVVTLSLESTA